MRLNNPIVPLHGGAVTLRQRHAGQRERRFHRASQRRRRGARRCCVTEGDLRISLVVDRSANAANEPLRARSAAAHRASGLAKPGHQLDEVGLAAGRRSCGTGGGGGSSPSTRRCRAPRRSRGTPPTCTMASSTRSSVGVSLKVLAMTSGGDWRVQRRLVHEQRGGRRIGAAGAAARAGGERQHVGDMALAVARRRAARRCP